jgi:hypothetical protein
MPVIVSAKVASVPNGSDRRWSSRDAVIGCLTGRGDATGDVFFSGFALGFALGFAAGLGGGLGFACGVAFALSFGFFAAAGFDFEGAAFATAGLLAGLPLNAESSASM